MPRRETLVETGVPAALAVLLYLNALRGEFVFDDLFAIVRNKDATGASPLSDVFLHDFWGQSMTSPSSHKSYRPLTVLLFRCLSALSGGRPNAVVFHLAAIALHATATALVAVLTRRLVEIAQPPPPKRADGRPGSKRPPSASSAPAPASSSSSAPASSASPFVHAASLLASLAFAAHPAHVEAVAGAVGIAETLGASLAIAALLAFFAARKSWGDAALPRAGGERGEDAFPWRPVLCFGAYLGLSFAAALAKEPAVTVLASSFVLDWLLPVEAQESAGAGGRETRPAGSERVPRPTDGSGDEEEEEEGEGEEELPPVSGAVSRAGPATLSSPSLRRRRRPDGASGAPSGSGDADADAATRASNAPFETAIEAEGPSPASDARGAAPSGRPRGPGHPSGRVGSPSEHLGSPSRRVGSPSEHLGSPSRRVGSPSEHLGSPSRRVGSPSEHLGSPSRRVGSPSEHLGSPSRRVGSPSEHLSSPSRRLSPPSGLSWRALSSPLVSGRFCAILVRLCLSLLVLAFYLRLRSRVSGGSQILSLRRRVENPLELAPTRALRALSIAQLHAAYVGLLLLPLRLSADWSYRCVELALGAGDARNAGVVALYAWLLWVALRADPLGPPTAAAVRGPDGETEGGKGKHDRGLGDANAAAADDSDERMRRARRERTAPSSRAVAALLRRRLTAAVAAALLALPFLPASNVFFYVGTYIAERLLYLPSVGFCLLFGLWAAPAFVGRGSEGGRGPEGGRDERGPGGAGNERGPGGGRSEKSPGGARDEKGPVSGKLAAESLARSPASPSSSSHPSPGSFSLRRRLAVVFLIFLSVRTAVRVPAWRSDRSVFEAALRTCPRSAKVHANLGILARARGEWEEANAHFRRAAALAPFYCEPRAFEGQTHLARANATLARARQLGRSAEEAHALGRALQEAIDAEKSGKEGEGRDRRAETEGTRARTGRPAEEAPGVPDPDSPSSSASSGNRHDRLALQGAFSRSMSSLMAEAVAEALSRGAPATAEAPLRRLGPLRAAAAVSERLVQAAFADVESGTRALEEALTCPYAAPDALASLSSTYAMLASPGAGPESRRVEAAERWAAVLLRPEVARYAEGVSYAEQAAVAWAKAGAVAQAKRALGVARRGLEGARPNPGPELYIPVRSPATQEDIDGLRACLDAFAGAVTALGRWNAHGDEPGEEDAGGAGAGDRPESGPTDGGRGAPDGPGRKGASARALADRERAILDAHGAHVPESSALASSLSGAAEGRPGAKEALLFADSETVGSGVAPTAIEPALRARRRETGGLTGGESREDGEDSEVAAGKASSAPEAAGTAFSAPEAAGTASSPSSSSSSASPPGHSPVVLGALYSFLRAAWSLPAGTCSLGSRPHAELLNLVQSSSPLDPFLQMAWADALDAIGGDRGLEAAGHARAAATLFGARLKAIGDAEAVGGTGARGAPAEPPAASGSPSSALPLLPASLDGVVAPDGGAVADPAYALPRFLSALARPPARGVPPAAACDAAHAWCAAAEELREASMGGGAGRLVEEHLKACQLRINQLGCHRVV